MHKKTNRNMQHAAYCIQQLFNRSSFNIKKQEKKHKDSKKKTIYYSRRDIQTVHYHTQKLFGGLFLKLPVLQQMQQILNIQY